MRGTWFAGLALLATSLACTCGRTSTVESPPADLGDTDGATATRPTPTDDGGERPAARLNDDPLSVDERTFHFGDGRSKTYKHNPGQIACMREVCTDLTKEGTVNKCRYEHCTLTGQKLDVALDEFRVENGRLRASAHVAGDPGRYGSHAAWPVWIGLTVVDADGKEFDLPAMAVKAADEKATFEGTVPDSLTAVGVAAWYEKHDPCKVDRHGCNTYGYALDELAAAWPDTAYDRAFAPQAIPPANLAVTVLAAGAPADKVAKVKDGVGAALEKVLGPFGTKVTVTDGGNASNGRSNVEILFKDEANAQIAAELGDALSEQLGGADVTERSWSEAPADFLVAVGGK